MRNVSNLVDLLIAQYEAVARQKSLEPRLFVQPSAVEGRMEKPNFANSISWGTPAS
jgi:hypothetical protein